MTPMRWSLGAAMLCASAAVYGHESVTSYLTVDTTRDALSASLMWDVTVRGMHDLIDLDANADGRITWGEVHSHRAAIDRLTARRLTVRRGKARCETSLDTMQLRQIAGVPHVALFLTARCAREGPFEIGSKLFAEEASERTLLELRTPAGTASSVLSPDHLYRQQPD